MMLGVVMERVVIRHFYHRPHEDQLLVTFGLEHLFRRDRAADLFEPIEDLCRRRRCSAASPSLGFMYYPTYRLAVVGIVAVALGALFLVLYRTRLGMIVRAGIEDSVMVDALGINVYRVFMVVFGIGAMAAGFAGIINAPVVSLTPGVGDDILVETFVVVVIGGVGSFPWRHPRRPDRRRDHQHHVDVQPRLRLRNAVCSDGACARGATARSARRAGPRVTDPANAQATLFPD